jgi:hypothetical protein
MVVSGRELRPATKGEVTDFQVRDAASREPVRVPGLGKEGLAQLLANGGAPGASTAEGLPDHLHVRASLPRRAARIEAIGQVD